MCPFYIIYEEGAIDGGEDKNKKKLLGNDPYVYMLLWLGHIWHIYRQV